MVWETKLYYGQTQSTALELTGVSSLQPTFTFSTSSQEGINAEYPITVTHNGINTPSLTISGDLLLGSNQKLRDKLGTEITKNTIADMYTIISNAKYKFKIFPFKLAEDNVVTNATATRDYFMGYLKSIQFSPTTRYVGDYVGDVVTYTMTFSLTGD